MDWDSVDALGSWLGRWVAGAYRYSLLFTVIHYACSCIPWGVIGGLGLRHITTLLVAIFDCYWF